MMNDVGKALYAGADDYIVKPFEAEELGEMVRRKFENIVKT